uniref:Uncharacterized protein n=1 Tax=Lepeophtheirus salmonis TaxID=72036 RepID=A0A0K2T5L7_LEPSM
MLSFSLAHKFLPMTLYKANEIL